MKIYQEAERFVNEQFYNGTFDNRSKLRIGDIIGAELERRNKEKDPDYYNHRRGVIHSSSMYGCIRGLVHQAIGSPKTSVPEPRKLGIFEAGNMFEDFIIESLGSRVLERQREYNYQHKSITLVGRSDYRVDDEGVMRIGENKSVHSDSFWYRQREGTLVAWHNQLQLQIYMWLERKLFGNEWEGIFSYISKDDCTVESAPVKFNENVINEIIIPVLDMVNGIFETLVASGLLEKRDEVAKVSTQKELMDDPAFAAVQEEINAIINKLAPAPDLAIYNEQKKQWQINWLCKYNDYADHCYGKGWLLEAGDIVKRKNAESKGKGFADTINAVKNGNGTV